jgi:hypothetical protein
MGRPFRLLRHVPYLRKVTRGSQRFLAESYLETLSLTDRHDLTLISRSLQRLQKTCKTYMAVARVLDITELLETILLQLSAREILAVKPVSRSWKRLIERSILLRRATFHTPDRRVMQRSPESISEHLSTVLSLRDIPTLQGKHFEAVPLFHSWDRLDEPRRSKPWIYQIKPTYMTEKQLHTFHWGNDVDIGRGLSPAIRSMFITQPPVTTILLFIQHRAFSNSSPCVTLHILSGVTLGAVVDTFAKMLDQVRRAELEAMCKTFLPVFGGTFLTSV